MGLDRLQEFQIPSGRLGLGDRDVACHPISIFSILWLGDPLDEFSASLAVHAGVMEVFGRKCDSTRVPPAFGAILWRSLNPSLDRQFINFDVHTTIVQKNPQSEALRGFQNPNLE
ncbi:hypothetical protein IQ235_13630 [Oscillatoriales cyanobacterium LEGE 11467]|uniref:Uncharacterized protein n=1 Tax=Zarconia navalis LEGE 11467 TaxID=1828826 RepID=A0A928W0Q7_9CYAN|nr:hypothetical protein [Zarconia navalis]MBE9041821.1 hypothetical protein [Zarconia navalis LEGE 11467]